MFFVPPPPSPVGGGEHLSRPHLWCLYKYTREDQSNVPVPQAKASVSDLDYIIFSVNDFEDKIYELKDNSSSGPNQISGKTA